MADEFLWLKRRLRRTAYALFKRLGLTRLHQNKLAKILQQNPSAPIIVFHPGLEWNMPLFQRPQHIATNLAKAGALYFYATPNAKYDWQCGFREISSNCFLTDRFDLLTDIRNREKFLHLYSSDMSLDESRLESLASNWSKIIYEYIDEIHPKLSSCAENPGILQRHKRLLKDPETLVITTAKRLFDDAMQQRKSTRNIIMVGNGADCIHFAKSGPAPAQISAFLSRHPIRIGYFGAFASWFDYPLIRKIATERPEYGIILIGTDFDGSMAAANLDSYSNILLTGCIPYHDLPAYANQFTVGIIPFLINDITLATSPIKLFEYMAAGLPVVSTNLPECAQIPSVAIAANHESFLAALDTAVTASKLPGSAEHMREIAAKHDWSAKAREIFAHLAKT